MGNQSEMRIVLGSKRFATSTDQDVQVQLPLIGDRRNFVEGERSVMINLEERFNIERQESDLFRITGKVTNVFNNSITGITNYTPFLNDLYYVGENESVNTNVWQGYPQFSEFTFGRENGISGHVPFVPKSAYTYNWKLYVSYAFSSTTAQTMSYKDEEFPSNVNIFPVHKGVPFVIKQSEFNGNQLVSFYCGTNHNLTEGQWVELSFTIAGKRVFQVYSLGDGTYDSERRVFSIYNLKYPSTDTWDGRAGNMKRIVNLQNSGETKSRYYVRLHKILTTDSDGKITKTGFENNPFPIKRKLEYEGLTPNQTQRISTKEGSQTFSFYFNKNIPINPLLDNNGKPVTELFVTIIEKGYMGWFNNPAPLQNTAIDLGWQFNFLKNSIDPWWNHSSINNKDNLPVQSYTLNGQTFFYNSDLQEGHILKGDFCEYNDIEQKEYVVSKLYHKYSFNPTFFIDNSQPNYPSGYCYIPHHSVPIRVFSDTIEFGSKDQVDNIPTYAWYSDYEENWFWRDIYDYGFTDNNNNGLNIPFINGEHYPFKEILFLQTPISRNNLVDTTIIPRLINDDCE